MVIISTFNFPKSKTGLNVYIGSLNVPYDSTNGNKQYITSIPVSFKLNYTNYYTSAQVMTVSFTTPTLSNVYKNGVLLGTTALNAYPSVNSKSFFVGTSGTQITFQFNSYFMNLFLNYQPSAPSTFGTTDVYDFYAIMNYNFTSTLTSFDYVGNFAISWGWVINTTISTSSFSNFAYSGGSSDSSGYESYFQDQQLQLNSVLDGTAFGGYTPPVTNPSNWTGIYTLMGMYLRNLLVVGGGIILKQTIPTGGTSGGTQVIQWNKTDTSGGGAFALIYGSTSSNALNFDIDSSLTNGFIFSRGGNTLFQISPYQSNINYNLAGGGAVTTVTTNSEGVFMYVLGGNYGDPNITATTFVSAGGGTCRLFNQYLPPGFGLTLTATGGQTFTISASYPPIYNSFSVKWIKIA